MLERVELGTALPQVVADRCDVDQQVHGSEQQPQGIADEHVHGQWPAKRLIPEQQPEPDCQHDPDDGLGVDRVDRCPVGGVQRCEPAGQQVCPPEREDHPRRGVGPGVRVGQRAVQDGDDHQEAAESGQDLLGHRAPRIAVVERVELGGHLVRPEEDRGGVIVEDVKGADQDRRQEDRLADRPLRVAGLLAERGRRLEADEGKEAEDHSRQDRRETRVPGHEDVQGVAATGIDDEEHRDQQEDPDLDPAQQDANPSREGDPAVGEVPDESGAHQGPDDPGDVAREADALEQNRAVQPEGREQRRWDERLGEEERPGHQPAEERAETPAHVGVHAAGRRQVPGELADRVRGQ